MFAMDYIQQSTSLEAQLSAIESWEMISASTFDNILVKKLKNGCTDPT